jgi:hypothetical protein
MDIIILISVVVLAILSFLNLVLMTTATGFLVRIADIVSENKFQIAETQDMLEQQSVFMAEQVKQVQMGNRAISKFILEMHGFTESTIPPEEA